MRTINNNSDHRLSQQEVKYFDILLNNSSKQQLDFINHMIDRDNNFQEIFESQTSVSKRIKVPRRSVSRLSTTVSQKGLVIKKSRGRNGLMKNTCQYILPEIWDDPAVRNRYKHILPALQIKKRYSSIQSVRNSKYLSYKIIQTASVAYINIPSYCLFINKVNDGTNMHIKSERTNCKSEKVTFQNVIKRQKGRKMSIPQKGFNEVAQKWREAYPKEAVKYADKKMQGRQPKGDAWLYYRKILNEYCETHNVEPNYELLGSFEGIPRLVLPIPHVSQIAQPTTTFSQKSEEKRQKQPRVQQTYNEVPESSLTQQEKDKLRSTFKGWQACLSVTNDARLATDYQNKLNNMRSKYPYLFETPISPQIKPESITLNESDYDEVLD